MKPKFATVVIGGNSCSRKEMIDLQHYRRIMVKLYCMNYASLLRIVCFGCQLQSLLLRIWSSRKRPRGHFRNFEWRFSFGLRIGIVVQASGQDFMAVPLGRVWKNSRGACSTVVPIVLVLKMHILSYNCGRACAESCRHIVEDSRTKQKNTGELKKRKLPRHLRTRPSL